MLFYTYFSHYAFVSVTMLVLYPGGGVGILIFCMYIDLVDFFKFEILKQKKIISWGYEGFC